MYSARIEGRQSDMTVAVYRGENMEESWQREIAKYHKIWHPNFVQLYGIVSSPRLYATIFHDELLPAGQYIEEDRRSMISVVYLYTFWSGELKDATAHFSTLVGSRALKIISFESSIWIRRSTARLCVELSKTSGSSRIYPFPWVDLALIPISLRSDQESAMVSSLTLAQYHHICYLYLRKSSWLETKHAEIRLHSIISLKEGKNQQIALIPNAMVRDLGWTRLSTIPGVQQSVVVVESGWTRFTLPSVEQARITLHLTVQPHIGSIPDLARWWLSQANHILRLYSNSVDYEEYSVVSSIQYQLTFLSTAEIDPEVYLFLCPLEDLISEDGDFIERPECPAYWSLDPSGCQRLGPKETSVHGLPTFEWKRRVLVNFWDEHVYAGLSQFHAEKGFDPNSQDIARHLEYPLYRLSCDPGPDHARSEEVSAEEPDLGPMNQAKITEHSQTDNEDCKISLGHFQILNEKL
ncbi:hypothetical protein B0H11DRAFT_1963909 [Mycena galericulata]|nr:hypothetical protein B0H11DRAFT_1963909 [Mycena galericulata]